MRWFLAAVSAVTICVSPVQAADTVSHRLVSAFKDVCLEQLTIGEIVASPGFQALSDDQLIALSRNFGSPEPFDAAWAEPSGDWVRLQKDLEQPELCQFVSFRAQPHSVVEQWNALFVGAFRQEGPARVRETRNGIRAGGFSSKPIEDEFIQASFSLFTVNETVITILVAIKLPQSPASCELWPEETDKCPIN